VTASQSAPDPGALRRDKALIVHPDRPIGAAVRLAGVTAMLAAMPVGPHGVTFGKDKGHGTVVNHRAEGVWAVSFRFNRQTDLGHYAEPEWAAEAVLAGEHTARESSRALRELADRRAGQ
jgi:hypothetical protein